MRNRFGVGVIVLLICSQMQIRAQSREIQGFDLSNPVEVITLDSDLREISGLAVGKDHFYAVEDEHGRVYVLDKVTGEILAKWRFHKDGDFEDLVFLDSAFYVLKSNGKIYKTTLFGEEEKTIKCDPGFSSSWNFEGMSYSTSDECLLLAAKRSTSARVKEIYCVHFDEKCNDLYHRGNIDQSEVGDFYRRSKKTWLSRLSHDIGSVSYSFNPSAIDVHPKTGKVFVLSSPVPQLLVLNEDWEIEEAIFLDQGMFRQPESMCFDTDGNLFIANEGDGGKANILKFVPR